MEQAVEKFRNWLELEINQVSVIAKKDAKEKYRQYVLSISILEEDVEKISTEIHSDLIQKYRQDGTIEEASKIDYILSILNDSEQKIITNHVLFADFELLCRLLTKSDLNAKEKVNIILFFLEKNMRDFMEEAILIDYNDINDLKMPNMSEKEFEEFIKGDGFQQFIEKDFEELTEDEITFGIQLEKRIQEKKLSNTFLSALKTIQRHYYSKKEKWEQNDILITVKAMEILGISPDICASFQNVMQKHIAKTKQQQHLSMVNGNANKKTEYNYKTLEKEVEEVIDLKDMKPKRYLSLDEKVYYLSILTKMKVSKEERKLFLRNCEMSLEKTSPLREYIENYNRLKYYEESIGLQKENSFMEECFQEMMLCSHEDYSVWRQSLEETLKQVEHWIPKNYEYEEQEASRLLKK